MESIISTGFWVFFLPTWITGSVMLLVVRPWAGPQGPLSTEESDPRRWPGTALALSIALSIWAASDNLLFGGLNIHLAHVALAIGAMALLTTYGRWSRLGQSVLRLMAGLGTGGLLVLPLSAGGQWSWQHAAGAAGILGGVGFVLWEAIESASQREERSSVIISLVLVAAASSLALWFGDSALLARTAGTLPAGLAGVLAVTLIVPRKRALASLWGVSALYIAASLGAGVLYGGTSLATAGLIALAGMAIWSPIPFSRLGVRISALRAVRVATVSLLVASGVGYQLLGQPSQDQNKDTTKATTATNETGNGWVPPG